MADGTGKDQMVRTGIAGLDEILGGGLTRNRIYLLDGAPGAGKTTLAMQFLMEGASLNEVSLYVTLSETDAELTASATSHGWDLRGVTIREYMPKDSALANQSELTMFHSSEVELGETLSRILRDIDEIKPSRVVIDALSEFRVLSETQLRYRRQILALKRFFMDRDCTVLMLDDRSDGDRDNHVESIAHGVISLEHGLTPYGMDTRRARVRKFRGRSFRPGLHDYLVRRGGLVVFPRLIAGEHEGAFDRIAVSSGIGEIDALLGGGPQMGSSTLFIGPAGTGKTTVVMQYVAAAAARGQRVTVFMFDELRELMIDRLKAIGLNLESLEANGTLSLRQIDPVELSPGELAAQVRADVEAGVRMVVIDSLNGYLNAMPHDEFLGPQLHALFGYLGVKGVVTMLVVGQQGIVGGNMTTPVDASYLVDSVVLFRFFEVQGTVRKAISVTKKRGGGHENTIRELVIDDKGVRVGEPLVAFHGVLTGIPTMLAPGATNTSAPVL